MNEDKLKEIIADTFDIDEDEINDDMNSDSVERWDSLNHLRLVTALEDEFDIKLTMEDVNTMVDYSKIVEFVSKYTGQ
jgi:acyl carrier protein